VRVFAVDKPLGFSSHDVVARARRLLATRRVGHAGTLDPLATGVLVLLVDEATKLAPFLSGADKTYLAWIALGLGSATLDAEGPLVERADASALDEPAICAALRPFLTLREQRPPAHSAVQRSGQRAYAAARRGEPLDLPPRPAGYFELELLALTPPGAPRPERLTPAADGWRPASPGEAGVPLTLPGPAAPAPLALVRTRVAAGTYVRALARDLGAALGVPAHLAGLVRTGAGALDLARCVPLEALPEAAALDPVALLPFPRIALDEEQARAVRDGKRLAAEWSGRAALLDPDGRLAAIADAVDGRLRLVRVWR
jgi:tRNA pseudouridine55 synthase